ncbi:Lrp/AsnC family transcriptional regulator [Sphingomonas sp. 2R-10]|uniref:Lrp/AsnC family transcriptional regulator n=1 Tax=Sphingomonas sp. 2R-10 TaxID=3045148 RepID=UPI0013DDCB08|nr:Lrp/AsnC family transcriptional regulator [Sphingomonas sp. 2R-10]MDJ0278298.1 Lrp/AsnC family transcriptional regulator [Sphingomonas sp. 2R-10]
MRGRLDAIDRRILDSLQTDSSVPIADIAETAGCSTTACWRRIDGFRQSGLIRKHVALLDRGKLNLGLTVFVYVSLRWHHADQLTAFHEHISALPQVVECYAAFGEVDYILKIVAPSIEHFETFFHATLSRIEIIRSIKSTVTMREIKSTTALPVPP